ncbi:hypothetical protein C2845_PM09G00470 [Panicum miliaceum]|uniref:adenylate kinase n=1 Tax=Panicum miliaceum TaxID=4540 RepID=A0A3L6RYQ5_PANMI|nr:hypothetical protein C2845_PM09G00470 [Panicum miliaceum]
MADAIKNEVGSFPPGKKITVVFVIGGPGSGKGTQCSKIVKHFGFTHLSAGDLLREEAKSDTEQGMMIKNMMHEGKLVPSDLIVKLLLKAMLQSGNDKFLVDGFPRNEENRQAYDSIISIEPEFVLFIDCPKEEMERRILNRNQGRDDDNIDTARRRFEVFQDSTMPVVQYYEKRGKLRRLPTSHLQVDGVKSADEVFEDVKAIFVQLNTQANQGGNVSSRARSNPFKRFLDLFCDKVGVLQVDSSSPSVGRSKAISALCFCPGNDLAKLEISVFLHHFLLGYEQPNPKCMPAGCGTCPTHPRTVDN